MSRWRCSVLWGVLLLASACRVTAPAPINPVPSKDQVSWQKIERYAFIHFSMNTFTDMEWGFGDKDPKLFNPSSLDCRQWARIIKDAGFNGIILTTKHHDGFCLWPSKYTDYSVKASPWRGGKGDLLAELSAACKEYGLKLGFYLSPWDRNSAVYGKPEYVTYFRNQLKEILTNYGDIFEVWFDGANGGDGYYGGTNEVRKIDNRTYYDWPTTNKLVKELQPHAIIFSDAGPGTRWCGNEEGWVGETNWSFLRHKEFWPGNPHYKLLINGQEDGDSWIPAEVNTSIRPGWFYHPAEDFKVKPYYKLVDIYYASIGRNANLILNIPIDRRGLIHPTDSAALMQMAQVIKDDFAHNLAFKKKAYTDKVRENSHKYDASKVVDGNPDTYWAPDDSVRKASITIELGEPTEINRFLVQEPISMGQRVRKFSLEAQVDGAWKTIDNQTTIGNKRILRFPTIKATAVRLNILDARTCPLISNIELFNAPKLMEAPAYSRNMQGEITLKAIDPDVQIFYTTDGSTPTRSSVLYSKPVQVNAPCTFKYVVYDPIESKYSQVVSKPVDISREGWSVIGSESKSTARMFDGDTYTAYVQKSESLPAQVSVDLGKSYSLTGFRYLPDQNSFLNNAVTGYQFFTSEDGQSWQLVSEGEFSNIKNNPIEQEKTFKQTSARYIRLKALRTTNSNTEFGIAELEVITNPK